MEILAHQYGSDGYLRHLVDSVSSVLYHEDRDGTILWVSSSIKRALGWGPPQLIGRRIEEYIHGEDVHKAAIIRTMCSNGAQSGARLRMVRPDGDLSWVDISAAPYRGADGSACGTAASLTVVSPQVLIDAEISKRDKRDELTSALSRRSILDRIAAALDGKKHRSGGGLCAVMFCDIDNLREVNSRFGHLGGDVLLHSVADRMRAALRTSDAVGRIGGDEFLILASGLSSMNDATGLGEKVRAAVSLPVRMPGGDLYVPSISIGVSILSAECTREDIDDLIHNANRGLYTAKGLGRNQVVFVPLAEL